ncbi:hypothetical protein SAMN02800694_2787 [Luteibacter sp. UNCMF331Sha3.1]|uniref:hypothetical protein n=1 Tax=Luteibacter sp. UNCMF331Sha3.1 TaxID=1502760 RepID=UPI0008D3E2C0|nr:hypothetical protein [Luteibacter sp. UNCMF331Sha3.1]SEN10542.1 hypothetical protein SAMN02800694_2787 [Luteibacter sp. UNCMF331Sha3.1]
MDASDARARAGHSFAMRDAIRRIGMPWYLPHPYDELSRRRLERAARSLAGRIEPDPRRVDAWWREETIAALDHLTAAELCARGRVVDLQAFLLDVARAETSPASPGDG